MPPLMQPLALSPEPLARQDSAMRDIVTLECTTCKRRNYTTTKNKKKTTDRLEFSKYCRFCRKHQGHRESKKREQAAGCRLQASGSTWARARPRLQPVASGP